MPITYQFSGASVTFGALGTDTITGTFTIDESQTSFPVIATDITISGPLNPGHYIYRTGWYAIAQPVGIFGIGITSSSSNAFGLSIQFANRLASVPDPLAISFTVPTYVYTTSFDIFSTGTIITATAVSGQVVPLSNLTIASSDKAETAALNLSENSTGGITSTPQTGTIRFTDTNTSARPSGSITNQTATVTDAFGDTVALTANQRLALFNAFTIQNAPGTTNNGAVNWTYNPQGAALNFLLEGETAVVTSTVRVSDQTYTDTATVAVTLKGAPDDIHLNVALGSGGYGTITAFNHNQPLALSSTGSNQANIAYDDCMPIPAGTYQVLLRNSPNANLGEVLAFSRADGTSLFPDRTAIELHIGNTPGDSAGCVVTGNGSVNGVATNSYWNGLLDVLNSIVNAESLSPNGGGYYTFQNPVTVTVSGNNVQPTLQILPTSTTLNRGSSEIIDFVVGGLQPASPVVDKDINVYFKVLGATATQSLLTDAELTSWTGPTGVTYSNVFRATIHGTNQQTNTGHNDVKVTLNTAGLTSRSLTIQMVGYDGTSYETNGTTFSYKPPGGSISVQPMLEGANPVTLNLIAPKPSGTTADLILRHDADGQYEIYNIGNNSILAGYLLGQVGTDYQVAGLGAFNGSGQSGAISSASVVSMSAASTSDMMLRSSTTGSFWIYNISANNIVGAASLGAVGLNWQMAGLGDFNHDGTTDMMLRNSGNGAFYVYDINSNQISFATPMGAVGLDWQMAGFGDFNGDGTTDMLLRNTSSGTFEFYDIVNNQLTSANVLGTVGLDWKVAGFGDFNGDGTTDMMLRNATSGMFELYNINNNSLTGASAIGTVGLDWQVAGFGPISGTGNSDMVLRNVSTGAFEVYDIANNQLTGAASLGQVGLDWQFGGFAVDSPSASGASTDDAAQVPQLVQAMAGFSSGSGAAENLNALALGADTAQEPVLTTVQHV